MPAHGNLPAPTDRRPYRGTSESGDEQIVYSIDATGRVMDRVYRQIGWHGQSGAFYALGERPSDHEPGSYSPIWVIAHADDIVPEDLIAKLGPENPIAKIRDCRDVQGQNGTWDTSGYMRGLYNGLELALSILEGERAPEFRDAPAESSDA
jgi:hypothetical protein